MVGLPLRVSLMGLIDLHFIDPLEVTTRMLSVLQHRLTATQLQSALMYETNSKINQTAQSLNTFPPK